MLVGSIWIVEHFLNLQLKGSYGLIYDKIENIKPENKLILIQDLKDRTGLDIFDVKIENIDLLHDTAQIKAFYNEKSES